MAKLTWRLFSKVFSVTDFVVLETRVPGMGTFLAKDAVVLTDRFPVLLLEKINEKL